MLGQCGFGLVLRFKSEIECNTYESCIHSGCSRFLLCFGVHLTIPVFLFTSVDCNKCHNFFMENAIH